MTIQETKDFMDRVKSYYTAFIVDEFTSREWHSQLKDYEASDINERFNQHLKSETYGEYIPKINYLIKGLRKIGEPGVDKSKIYVRCNKCSHIYSLAEKEEHDQLCCDIDYFNFLAEKYTGKSIDKEKCFEAEDFYSRFKGALKLAISKEQDQEELSRLDEILKILEIEGKC